MSSRLSRRLQFIFAFSYAVFLIAGAFPYKWLPKSWHPARTKFAKIQFENFRVLPGMGVFNFPKELNPFQMISACMEVEVRLKNGQVKKFDDFPCPVRKTGYSFFQNPSRTFYANIAGFGMYGTDQPHSQNFYVLATAEYFCRKYEGDMAVIRFSSYYQNLENRTLMARPKVPQAVDCKRLRSPG